MTLMIREAKNAIIAIASTNPKMSICVLSRAIAATATIGQWEINANNICFVTMGAEITNVQFSGVTVEVTGSLNLYNNDRTIIVVIS